MTGASPLLPGETQSKPLVALLAAGAGTRFSDIGHKLLARRATGEPTVIELALRSALKADCGPVLLVTGALDEDALRAEPAIARLLDGDDSDTDGPTRPVTVRHNAAWQTGQASSLQIVIDEATHAGTDAIVVGLADQPFIDPTAWTAISAGLGRISVATYDGRRGNPVRIHSSVWKHLPTSGDEGARSLMRDRPDLVVEVACSGSPTDIDTLEDLHQWQSNWSTNSP